MQALALLVVTGCAPASEPAEVPFALALPFASDEEFDKRLVQAGRDIEKLWELHRWCESTERETEARKVLQRIVRYDESNRRAHELLGHVELDGQWFPSQKQLDDFKKKDEQRLAKERGWVRYKGRYVPPGDVAFLERGLVRGPEGDWLEPEELERLEQGWKRQDLVWVPPDEVSQMDAGLWKCGEEWKTLEEANDYHSRPGSWWRIPYPRFVLWTTVDRAVAEKAAMEMELAWRELVRIFGIQPAGRIDVALLRNQEQYDRFALGDDIRPATQVSRIYSLADAYFAESWYEAEYGYLGMGVGFWNDSSEVGGRWGRHAARRAIGLSFAYAVDPSPKALAAVENHAPDDGWVSRYLEEKKIPTWFRYGAVAYVERYFEDTLVGQGGDPWWVRKWSIESLKGELAPLEQVFDLKISSEVEGEYESSRKLVNQVGLVLAFVLDGGCQPLVELHGEMVEALKKGQDPGKILDKLRKEIEKHEEPLKAFAEL